MRSVSPEIEAVIESDSSYSSFVYGKLYPSRLFFTSITEDNPVSGADAVGFPDSPMPQDIGLPIGSPPGDPTCYTFFNDGGTLKVAKNGEAASSLGVSITGKPGVCNNRLYRISGGSVYRHNITWTPSVSLDGGTNIGTPDETPLHIHAVAATYCVVLTDGDGGIRARVIINTTEYKAVDRFMFPMFVDTSGSGGGSGRTMDNLALYSGALFLDNKIFVYVSSLDGSTQGAYWDVHSQEWSDIFTAVPSNLQVSLCEFRVANAYDHGGVAYLAGQFKRTENVESDLYYSMILRSEDGKSFSVDRFGSVSDLGYRFLARVGEDNRLYLTNCNRVCYDDVVYTFDGDNENSQFIDIPSTSINRYESGNERATLELKASNEYLLFHEYTQEGNRVRLYLGYETTSGSQGDLYATYIIEGTNSSLRDGSRGLGLSLMNEGHWKLQNHTSPFYTEFFGKSSLYDTFDEELGSLYVAPQANQTRTYFFVDFWQCIPFSDADNGVTGINILNAGGVDAYTASGSHKLGIQVEDLKTVMSLDEYPEITATSINAKIYGWSRPDDSGSNDIVELCLIIKKADGTYTKVYTDENTRWPQTWPGTVAGENPITVTVSGLTVGEHIKGIALVFEASQTTVFVPSRVEILNNVRVPFVYDDPNTPWDTPTSGSGGLQIPGVGRPYIMFGQKPYNAYNFSVAASFEHTVQGPISTYPTAVGLVGLAEDGGNFVLGRYNRSNNRVEIVKVRDDIETVLAYDTPSSGSPGANVDLLFKHRNGHFEVYMPSGGIWTKELEYDWTEADSFMFTSETVAMKCGIYGYLSAPSFRIAGVNFASNEASSSVDGIPHLPMESLTDFPASGQVKIGDVVYAYTAKVTTPTLTQGPYQLRQNGNYQNPYGDGYGVEIRLFSWTAPASYSYKLLSISDGSCFKLRLISSSLWQIFIKTGGEKIYLRNRSRHYSENTLIGTKSYSTYMKVFITGGLEGITKVTGENAKHSEGELCQLHMEGNVICNWFYGAGGDDDVTIEDLIEKISAHAGAKTTFPGDITVAEQEISGGYLVGNADYREGFDLRFVTTGATDFTVRCDATDPRYEGGTGTQIQLNYISGNDYQLIFKTYPSGTNIERIRFTANIQEHDFRVLFHDNFVSFYMDGKWIHTFATPELVYPVNNNIRLQGSFTVYSVVLRDLSDWREAIYIDLETDAMSAISSVIQERPIEVSSKSDGSLAYWLDLVRDTVVQVILPRDHTWVERTPRDGASDAIVYGSDEVKCIQYQPYLQAYGFATKVMRFPNLKSGMLKAARKVLERAYEERIRHTVTIRPDLRLEVGDILSVAYEASGTATPMAMDVIIDNLSISQIGGRSHMIVEGREDL